MATSKMHILFFQGGMIDIYIYIISTYPQVYRLVKTSRFTQNTVPLDSQIQAADLSKPSLSRVRIPKSAASALIWTEEKKTRKWRNVTWKGTILKKNLSSFNHFWGAMASFQGSKSFAYKSCSPNLCKGNWAFRASCKPKLLVMPKKHPVARKEMSCQKQL